MKAAILAIGTELLGTDRLDTNSLTITALLERHGVSLVRKSVAGDDEAAIAQELERGSADADLVVVTGGLGPTLDDRTREAITILTGGALELDPAELSAIEDKYRRMDRRMPAVNRRQALVPAGARTLANPRGTAPGLVVVHGQARLFFFPGVPRELEAMLEAHLEVWLRERDDPDRVVEQVELRVACLPESVVEERLELAYAEYGHQPISLLARPGEVAVRLRAAGTPEARRRTLEAMTAKVRELVGAAVFSERGETLEVVVGDLLSAAGSTLSVAESCTGGMIGQRLTEVAGSSAYFAGGAIAYSNRLKSELLGVPSALIDVEGAVSAAVARAMAAGARERFGTTYALAVTGVAGPGGGSPDKPVGTVDFAVASSADEPLHRRVRFPGDRARVRLQAGQFGLELLRRVLIGLDTQILEDRRPLQAEASS